MKTVVIASLAGMAAVLVSVSVAGAEQPDFSRYQIIIDKNLFGEPVAEVVTPAAQGPATPAPPTFEKTLRLCGINEGNDGVWVYLVDVGVNPNKSISVKMGEEQDGIRVLDADVVAGRVSLKKGDVEASLSMDQQAAPAVPSVTKPTAMGVPGFMRMPPTPTPASAPTVNPVPAAPSAASIAERLRQRREALERMRAAATSPPPPAVTAPTNSVAEVSPHERMKKLREYNLELIKAKGTKGPPLPIQLTQEEDDQLVKEGVLPPSQ